MVGRHSVATSGALGRGFAAAVAGLLAVVLSTLTVAQSPGPPASASAGPPDMEPLRMHDARFSHTATALTDGSVLIVGGVDGESVLGSAEVFDPIERSFRRVGDLQAPRFGHRATALPDGRVLITGGASGGNPSGSRSVEVYDPGTETFSGLGRLDRPRFAHTASLLDGGRVLVAGGIGKGRSARPTSAAELFDPATGTSQPVKGMRVARHGHSATQLLDGRIAIIGGQRGGRPGEQTAEVFEPRVERFKRPFKLAAPVGAHEATRLEDGRILVVSVAPLLVAPDARSSRQLDRLPILAGYKTATLLDDGRVLIIGSRREEPARVVLFDPADDTFERAGAMRLTRQDHAAVLLPDGTVLVLGGLACPSQVTDTAEIWDPRALAPVTGGTQAECQPWVEPTPPPLPALGAETVGGRIEMPGSAFAITVPDDWSVELADPDTDVFAAAPGSAWEALRATNTAGTRACSVAVGVAEVSLRKRSGTSSNGVVEPKWHPNERGTLMVPSPRVNETDTSISSVSPMVRLHRDHEGLEHDALYSIDCAGVSGRRFEQLMQSFEFLPQGG